MIGATYSTEHYIEYNRTGNKNYFEEIIDMMILQEVAGLNESFRQAVKNLPKDKIRMAILSKLDRDRNLYLSIKGLLDSNIGKHEHIKDVVLMLRKYVKVSEVEKKKFGEVMTPLELVREMLSKLPNEVWSNPNLKWLDPANGTGPYPTMVIYKLMEGLTEWEPNEEKRYNHIVENMIYVCEIQPKNMFLWLCAIDPWDTYNLNIYCGSFLTEGFDKHMKEVWGVEKFDIIIGNPPYNEEFKEDNNRAKTLYNVFIERALPLTDYLLFVTPSRWLSGGFGLDNFREMMFKRTDIRLIKHFDNSVQIFKDVDIVGGVSYFLIDKNYNGNIDFNGTKCVLGKYDIFVEPQYNNLIDRFVGIDKLSSICRSQSYYGFPGNESLFTKEKNINDIKVYVSKQKGLEMWVDRTNIKDISKIDGWKVFTPAANGENPRFGTKILGRPDEVASKSYMVLLVNSENEAKSLISYMDTKFCNFFLSLRKNTQNMKPDTLSWIPVVPFDRIWDDEQLFTYFSLSEEEKNIILGKL